ncbi:MAG: nickel pincer cofactor biosynthesis protein LarB [Planctomycetes bacterium]|nr:nickel pincer cofactor biosynthesis protein LarB [Planctomycetota bacterium]
MSPDALRKLLDDVAAGRTPPAEAARRLADLPFEDLAFARVDHHRALRCGFPEVIFGQGKTCEQIESIFAALTERSPTVLATRVARDAAERVLRRFPDTRYDPLSRTLLRKSAAAPSRGGEFVGIVCAGTADLPVAEEARVTLDAVDLACETFYDVGVAGLHRLLAVSTRLREACALIVVAGMEGALPSVVGGLVDGPIVAVPTSVGYGASFGGVAALLAMLNSCASGVTVVNIDNGFGAAVHAARVVRQIRRAGRPEEPRG